MRKLASVELKLKGSACTDKALAFEDPEDLFGDPLWIPRSQITNLEEVLDSLPAGSLWTVEQNVTLHLPIWFVENASLDQYAEELEEEVT